LNDQAARNWISKTGIPDPTFLAILGRTSAIRMKEPDWLATNESPLWMRDYSRGKPKEGVAGRVDAALQALNVDRVCVSHTAYDNINSVLDGKVRRLGIGDGILSEYRFSSVIESWCRVS
jgi:hypothetical protein